MPLIDEAYRLGIDWASGRRQMIVVGDGSVIPTYIPPHSPYKKSKSVISMEA